MLQQKEKERSLVRVRRTLEPRRSCDENCHVMEISVEEALGENSEAGI